VIARVVLIQKQGKRCLTALTVLCCSTQSQYHVSDSTKSTHALSSNRLSKGTVLSIIMFEISTSSAPSAMECGAAFIGKTHHTSAISLGMDLIPLQSCVLESLLHRVPRRSRHESFANFATVGVHVDERGK
jgi:hypothetical protein